MRLLLALLLIISVQACTAEKKATNEHKTEKKTEQTTDTPAENFEFSKGLDISKELSNIEVKDHNGNLKTLAKLASNKKNNILIIVKKGCVFCDALVAILHEESKKIDSELLIALESHNATADDFKKKYKDNKVIQAKWLYDFDGQLANSFAIHSFPNMIIFDKNQKVLGTQVGLVLPENREQFKGMEFPQVLKILAEETSAWLKNPSKWEIMKASKKD